MFPHRRLPSTRGRTPALQPGEGAASLQPGEGAASLQLGGEAALQTGAPAGGEGAEEGDGASTLVEVYADLVRCAHPGS